MSETEQPAERWEIYPCWIGEDYGFVKVDLRWFDPAPIAAQPFSLRVHMKLRDPNEQGMPHGDEFQVLAACEDALLGATDDAILVGATVAGGVRNWYLYATDEDATVETLRQAAQAAAPAHDIEVGGFEDADWAQYFEFLYPNALAWQYIQDRQLLDHMERELGDDGTVPRPVSHWAYFPTRGARRAFIKGVKALDYRIQGKSTGDAGDDERFGVHFETRTDVAPHGITVHTEKLVQLALECDGRYDGWETMVVKAGEDAAG